MAAPIPDPPGDPLPKQIRQRTWGAAHSSLAPTSMMQIAVQPGDAAAGCQRRGFNAPANRSTYQESPLKQHIESSLREASGALDALRQNQPALAAIESAASLLIRVFEQEGRIYACGNGGSMCDAMHFAENYRDQTS